MALSRSAVADHNYAVGGRRGYCCEDQIQDLFPVRECWRPQPDCNSVFVQPGVRQHAHSNSSSPLVRENLGFPRFCGIPGLEAGDGWGESLGLRRLCRRRLRPGPDRLSAAGASAQRDHRCGISILEFGGCLGLSFLPRSVNRVPEIRTPVIGTRLVRRFSGPDTLLYSVL